MRSPVRLALDRYGIIQQDRAAGKKRRRGRLDVARLIEHHGADTRLPTFGKFWLGIARAAVPYRSMSAAACITRDWSLP
jgi:hypothetical protein